jgi:hypothetical protein
VDSDPELFRLYDWRVPVLLWNGRVLLEGRIDANAIQEAGIRSSSPGMITGS